MLKINLSIFNSFKRSFDIERVSFGACPLLFQNKNMPPSSGFNRNLSFSSESIIQTACCYYLQQGKYCVCIFVYSHSFTIKRTWWMFLADVLVLESFEETQERRQVSNYTITAAHLQRSRMVLSEVVFLEAVLLWTGLFWTWWIRGSWWQTPDICRNSKGWLERSVSPP